jgi:hypothetical protein
MIVSSGFGGGGFGGSSSMTTTGLRGSSAASMPAINASVCTGDVMEHSHSVED